MNEVFRAQQISAHGTLISQTLRLAPPAIKRCRNMVLIVSYLVLEDRENECKHLLTNQCYKAPEHCVSVSVWTCSLSRAIAMTFHFHTRFLLRQLRGNTVCAERALRLPRLAHCCLKCSAIERPYVAARRRRRDAFSGLRWHVPLGEHHRPKEASTWVSSYQLNRTRLRCQCLLVHSVILPRLSWAIAPTMASTECEGENDERTMRLDGGSLTSVDNKNIEHSSSMITNKR